MICHMVSTCPSRSSWALMASNCSLVVHSACFSSAASSCSKSNQSSLQRWAGSFDWAGTVVRKTSLTSSPSLFDQRVRSFWRYKNTHTMMRLHLQELSTLAWNKVTSQWSQRASATLLSCCSSNSEIWHLCFISSSWYTCRKGAKYIDTNGPACLVFFYLLQTLLHNICKQRRDLRRYKHDFETENYHGLLII